ncbi:tubulin-specific chaperone E, partial [Lecanoromycetidae sp. Uapishka_2]
MFKHNHTGQRLSYEDQLCTVRYVGPVAGTKGDWLGVEWDDADSPLGFFEALRKKYASGKEPNEQAASEDEIRISGKTVEEVGFEKIQLQVSNLKELQTVILDGLCIARLESDIPTKSTTYKDYAHNLKAINLDLGRNLLGNWADVADICTVLKFLRSLKLKFGAIDYPTPQQAINPFQNIEDLSLDDTLLSWDNIASLTTNFSSLKTLSISSNNLSSANSALKLLHLTKLDLSFNNFSSLNEIATLSTLPSLATLSLRKNPLTDLTSSSQNPIRFPTIQSLDLSSTHLPNQQSLNPIPSTFPNLTTLLTKNTPHSALPSSNLHTIARLATIKELNYQPITPMERQNAELYYLNTVAKELANTNISDQQALLSLHLRWDELCQKHGTPDITKPKVEAAAGTLGARVTEFTFHLAPSPSKTTPTGAQPLDKGTTNKHATAPKSTSTVEKRKLIPLTIDTYRLKGIVTHLFSLPPLGCRLIWETGVLDPVSGYDDEEGWSVSEDESDEDEKPRVKGKKGRWAEREVELVDGTREVGNFIQEKKVRVRVEVRDLPQYVHHE